MSHGIEQTDRIHFCHPLLHARDWQHRPLVDAVCRWWNEGGAGICSLVGIGGAGKTAIADRFVQVLPGGMPPRPDLPKRTDLRPPEQLFVFSFYDVPNPDSFFAELFAFLTSSSFVPSVPLCFQDPASENTAAQSTQSRESLRPARADALSAGRRIFEATRGQEKSDRCAERNSRDRFRLTTARSGFRQLQPQGRSMEESPLQTTRRTRPAGTHRHVGRSADCRG